MDSYVERSIPRSTTLAVTGMTCENCARAVERALAQVPEVRSVAVDFDLGLAIVNGGAASSELIAAIKAAGYGAVPLAVNGAGAASRTHASGYGGGS